MEGKKEKKGNLSKDVQNQMAKEFEYRSRACFKLMNINKKYNFLDKANVLIDLCAAPGCWLQVASKQCPATCVKIGLDIIPIKPIPGCKTFIQDITTPSCFSLLKRELKGSKADVILIDGEQNISEYSSKNAFNQIELTLSALKLACRYLRKGGTFLAKVSNSKYYKQLVWVCNKFFRKMEANVSKTSDNSPTETFLVCTDFIAPIFINDKLFDAEYIFKGTEGEQKEKQEEIEVNSIENIMAQRRKRREQGENAKDSTILEAISFEDFLKIDNPLGVFLTYNAISFPQECQDKYLPLATPPENWEDICGDILRISKREIVQILKWRVRILRAQRRAKSQSKKDRLDQFKSSEGDGDDVMEEEVDLSDYDELAHEKRSQRERDIENYGEEEDSDVENKRGDEKEQMKLLNRQLKQKEKHSSRDAKSSLDIKLANTKVDKELFIKDKGKSVIDIDKKSNKVEKLGQKSHRDFEKNLEAIYDSKQEKGFAVKKKRTKKDTGVKSESRVKNLRLEENEELLENVKMRENQLDKGLFGEDMSSSDESVKNEEDAGEFENDVNAFSQDSDDSIFDHEETKKARKEMKKREKAADSESKQKIKSQPQEQGIVDPLNKSHLSTQFTTYSRSGQLEDVNNVCSRNSEDGGSFIRKKKFVDINGEVSDDIGDNEKVNQIPRQNSEQRRSLMQNTGKLKKFKKEGDNISINVDGFEVDQKKERKEFQEKQKRSSVPFQLKFN